MFLGRMHVAAARHKNQFLARRQTRGQTRVFGPMQIIIYKLLCQQQVKLSPCAPRLLPPAPVQLPAGGQVQVNVKVLPGLLLPYSKVNCAARARHKTQVPGLGPRLV